MAKKQVCPLFASGADGPLQLPFAQTHRALRRRPHVLHKALREQAHKQECCTGPLWQHVASKQAMATASYAPVLLAARVVLRVAGSSNCARRGKCTRPEFTISLPCWWPDALIKKPPRTETSTSTHPRKTQYFNSLRHARLTSGLLGNSRRSYCLGSSGT